MWLITILLILILKPAGQRLKLLDHLVYDKMVEMFLNEHRLHEVRNEWKPNGAFGD